MKRFSVLLALLAGLLLRSAAQAQAALPSAPDSVGMALAMIYAPDSDAAWWQDAVCALMTQGGCGYFRAHQAQALRAAADGRRSAWVEFVASVGTLADGSQVWRYRVHIYAAGAAVGGLRPAVRDADAFVHVVGGKLNRILYGPYIPLTP